MAAKPKNYNRRVIDSRGAHFRIVSGDPLVGSTGAEVCKVYAVNDNDDSFLISHSQGGLSRIAAEKTLEVRAGDKNTPTLLILELVLLMEMSLLLLLTDLLESTLKIL